MSNNPFTNQRPFPNVGTGTTLGQFRENVQPWIDKGAEAISGAQLITAANNALNTPQEQRDALIWARSTGSLSAATEQQLTSKIAELNLFIHQTEGGPIR